MNIVTSGFPRIPNSSTNSRTCASHDSRHRSERDYGSGIDHKLKTLKGVAKSAVKLKALAELTSQSFLEQTRLQKGAVCAYVSHD